MTLIDHFTVVSSATWPLNDSDARGCFVFNTDLNQVVLK